MNSPVLTTLINKQLLSKDICNFTFRAAKGSFIGFEPGCHVDVMLENDLVKQYSVWEWSTQGDELSVAVKLEPQGNGGSIAMHKLIEGQEVNLSQPRNNFVLKDNGIPVTLVAGGIGVTPIYAMAQALKDMGTPFKVYYLVRSKEHAAFDGMFKALDLGDSYHLHCDDTDGRLDLNAAVAQVPDNGDLYTCGPEVLLNALQKACVNLKGGKLRFERFQPVVEENTSENSAFDIILDSSGERIRVESDKTILATLQENNIDIQVGCANGMCGACMLDVLEGDIDHRDNVLDDEEKLENDRMCVCVSRAKSEFLVLDI